MPTHNKTSKRATFARIVSDLLRFTPDQLEVVIRLARKVRRSRLELAEAAQEADALVLAMPDGLKRPQIEAATEN